MGITFNKQSKIFHIQAKNCSYVFCVSDFLTLEHLYYGSRISNDDVRYLSNRQIYSFQSHESRESRAFSTAVVGLEIAPFNSGDYRTPSVIYDYENCVDYNRLRYRSHKIYKGRRGVPGMPHSRNNDNCKTLEVLLADDSNTLQFKLFYTLYENEGVICRYQSVKNLGKSSLKIKKFASLNLDFYRCDLDVITLEGTYLSERSRVVRSPLRKGIFKNNSLVGISSHQRNPFIALCSHNANEDIGEAFGFNLVYSGNFSEEVEVNRLNCARLTMGIDDSGFCWNLESGKTFYSPEAVMVYSDQGLGGMSRIMHDHVRNNIIESEFAFKTHPVVINSWEASYFKVNEEILLNFADQAKLCGIDTIVLDDGWFRDGANHNLGDFYTIKEKFPSGLKELSKKIHQKGFKFGIWIEPEMVSPDSEFYRKNPDCALSTSKNPLISRNQYLLDLTDDKNVEKIANRIIEEFAGVEIDYIKWDFNRYMLEAGSKNCPSGEVYHRQTLGSYKLFEAIKGAFKGVFFENCAGGGGRFDLGMLYYAPQIWTSDNTDPYERLYIQYGTSYAYPTSSISCHFTEGVCTSGRSSTYAFRYNVACFGSYGYELDLTKFSNEDKLFFKELSNEYRKNEHLNLSGDLYRLISPESNEFCAYMKVSKDKKQAQLTFIYINANGLTESMLLKLRGLDAKKKYKNQNTGVVLRGDTLMNAGIRLNDLFRQKRSDGYVVNFIEVEQTGVCNEIT